MLGWVVRFILLLIVLRLLFRFVAGVLEGLRQPAQVSRGHGAARARAVPLAKDPVCGTYVVRDRALTTGTGGSQQFFCSDRCRDEWQRSQSSRRPA
jgi:YHS domain-containing protein